MNDDPELSGKRAQIDNSPMLSQNKSREYWLSLKHCPKCGREGVYVYSTIATSNTLEDIGDVLACGFSYCDWSHIVWRPGYE